MSEESRITSGDFKEFFSNYLERVDAELFQQNIDLQTRPVYATHLFTASFIEPPDGMTENYLEQEWFAEILGLAEEWYVRRYGKARMSYRVPITDGLIVIFQMPFLLAIPLLFSKIEVPGETTWLHFPNTVLDEEKPLSWIVDPPNFDALSSNNRAVLEKGIVEVATYTRQIHRDLITATLSDEVRPMARSIESHVSKCVIDICSRDDARRSIALWEAHLAVEKTVKVFLHQQGSRVDKVHSLDSLIETAEHSGLPAIDRKLVVALLDGKTAIKYRYNEISPPSVDQAVSLYGTSLQVISHCSGALNRNLRLNNARFLLKKPPWVRPASTKQSH